MADFPRGETRGPFSPAALPTGGCGRDGSTDSSVHTRAAQAGESSRKEAYRVLTHSIELADDGVDEGVVGHDVPPSNGHVECAGGRVQRLTASGCGERPSLGTQQRSARRSQRRHGRAAIARDKSTGERGSRSDDVATRCEPSQQRLPAAFRRNAQPRRRCGGSRHRFTALSKRLFFFLYGATTAARAAGVTFKTTVLRGRTFGPVVTATPFRPGSAERGEEEVGFSRAARDGDIRVLPECRVPTRKRIVSCSLQMDTEEQERTQLRWLRPRQLTVVAARANHAAKPGAPHADGGAASRTPGKTRARVSNSRDGGVSVSTAFRARGAL